MCQFTLAHHQAALYIRARLDWDSIVVGLVAVGALADMTGQSESDANDPERLRAS